MNSRFLFFFLFLCLTNPFELFGFQQKTTTLSQHKDSIQMLINSEYENDENRVKLLLELAQVHFYSLEIDLGLTSATKAYKLADSIGFKAFKPSHYVAVSAFFGEDLPDLRSYYQNKAQKEPQYQARSFENNIQTNNQSSVSDENLEERMRVLNKSLSLLSQLPNNELSVAVLCKLGHLSLLKGNLNEALDFFDKSTEQFRKMGELFPAFHSSAHKMSTLYIIDGLHSIREIEKELKITVLRNADNENYGLISKAMAASYARQGRFIMSIEYYLKSIEAFMLSKNLDMLPDLYRDLGIAYENLYLFEKSVDSFKKCIEMLNKLGDYNRLAELYLYMVFPLIDLEKYDEAQKYIELAENDTVFAKTVFHNARLSDARGQILMKQKKYREAITYFNRALEGFRSIEETHWGIPYVLLNVSACYGYLGQTETALKFALDSKSRIFEGQLKLARRTNQLISKLYETQGNFSPALRYLKEYENIVESSNKDDDLRILADAEIQSILERSNREIIALEREQQLVEQMNTTQRLWLTVIFGALLFTLLIAYVLFRNYRIKTRSNARLLREKEKVEDTLAQLRTTQRQLIEQEKLASLGQLTAGIAHEIKNPLNFITNYSELGTDLLKELEVAVGKDDKEEIKEVIHDLEKSLSKINKNGKRADSIVKGMLQHSRSGSSEKTPTDINALSREYLQLAYHAQKAINQGIRVDVETNLDPNMGTSVVNAQDVGRVILNVISNALFAVNERNRQGTDNYIPKVTLTTHRGEEMVSISVQDNGIGIPEEIKEKVFEPFFTTKKGTDGTGLGLSISYDIVKAHGGTLEISSDPNGTLASIHLPV